MEKQGKIRCARCVMVVLDLFTPIMQDLMKETGVPPEKVYDKIMKTKLFRDRLNRDEIHTIQTLATEGFSKLDVTLIYKIVKFFKIFIPPPTRQWGSDPQPGEIEVGDDVERIRRARNALLHKVNCEVSKEYMNEFFTTFIEVGRRIDQHLEKPANTGYEQAVRNYRDMQDVDEEMAEQYSLALLEIESYKEKFTVKVERKEIHILIGKTMDAAMQTIRQCEAESTTPVKFIIDGVEDPDEQIAMLNRLKDEFNTESGNIQFKKATKECIAVYCLIKNKVLRENDLLEMEVCSFIKHIFEVVDIRSSEQGEISVLMASAEDDCVYSTTIGPPVKTDPHGILSGSNSLVLNVEMKNDVFRTADTLQKYMTEFFGTLLKKTNGRQLIKQNGVNVILEPGDQDVTEDNEDTTENDKVSASTSVEKVEIVEKLRYDDSEYAIAQSPGPPSEETEESPDEISSDSIYKKAQFAVLSPGGEGLANIPPKFQQMKRERDKEEVVKHWKYYLGFRRLLELKEKDSFDIIHTFHTRKFYLMDALNDKDMYDNKEVMIFFLQCFAKCCDYDGIPEEVSDVFEILQYSSFLKESVVKFIDDIAVVSKLHRKNYYPKSMKDLFAVLNEIKSYKPVFKECIGPIMAVIEKREEFFKDSEIFDDSLLSAILELKDYANQMGLKLDIEKLGISDASQSKGKFFEKTKSRYDRQQKRRSEIQPEKWRPVLGYNKLNILKDVSGEEIVTTFVENIRDLKDALNDENLIKNKDMVSLFLHCLAKSSGVGVMTYSQVKIFEILIESIFLTRHVTSFVEGIAAGTPQPALVISTKQSLKDIFCIFDAFNTLIPQSVSRIHSILTSMDTSINIIHANHLMDEDMWHTFNTLMDRRTATSPEKRQ